MNDASDSRSTQSDNGSRPSATEEIPLPHGPLVFISHDSRDANVAEAFSRLLNSVTAGLLKSFRSSDRRGSQGFEYGVEWFPELMRQIGDASDVVCLLTERSLDRPWILYEAGVAKGKISATVHGLALGVPLKKASTGPFAQFQNCGDDVESITKLIIQLVKRLPNADPDREMVEVQVKSFKERVDELLEAFKGEAEDDAFPDGEGARDAQLFEEIKAMFQELPLRVESSIVNSGLQPLRGEILNPRALGDIAEMTRAGKGGEGISLLILASPFREIMPWLYEIATEVYRAECRRDREAVRRGWGDFVRAIEVAGQVPLRGGRDFRHLARDIMRLASRFVDLEELHVVSDIHSAD
ncbi:hypothetical protein [Streptomyces sp. NBC_01481]|uniref:hypothetical protein n=1 Tax=Streptomyces sp. NBC_01481 TaxID=2975869 RepID=UPI0022540813|nr:hypothetical protein [Streptomyces sp. NBC_01481]MCX4585062.1 toll/interleukin-1 receptor domain-containing protein [Streptomyces sp. NBC_01481]